MSSKYGWILSFVFVVAMIEIGCEKADTAAPADTTPAAGASTPSTPTLPPAPDAPTPAAPAIPAPDHTPTTQAVGAATQAAGANAAVATEEAQKLLDQALTYIKENKLD